MLGRLVELLTGTPLAQYARDRLFSPLGITDVRWRFVPDASSASTFCQLSLRPRDMAKFGLLYAQGGTWHGKQIIAQKWVDESTASHAMVGDTDYGWLWWRPYLNVGRTRVDAIAAQGNGGQEIWWFPKYDLIAVLTGGNYNRQSFTNTLLVNYVLPAVGVR